MIMVEIVFDSAAYGTVYAWKICELHEDVKTIRMVNLEFMLSYGYLSEGIESDYRIKLPLKMIMAGTGEKLAEEEFRSFGEEKLENWKKLKIYLKHGDPVRIWYSTNSDELCGLLHVCTLLKRYENEVTLVKCPEIVGYGSHFQFVHGWGQLHPDQITEYSYDSRRACKEEIRLYAEQWKELVKENAPLRAVISGRAASVPEDFYDFLIRKEFPFTRLKEVRLIGKIMGMSGFGVYGFWYKQRIQKMIQEGEIIIVKDADRDMNRYLKSKSKSENQ